MTQLEKDAAYILVNCTLESMVISGMAKDEAQAMDFLAAIVALLQDDSKFNKEGELV